MKRAEFIRILKEFGLEQTEIRDMYVCFLNTKERQEQMWSWVEANKESCDVEMIRRKAREILREALSSNPYNKAAKDMPIPKWEPLMGEEQGKEKEVLPEPQPQMESALDADLFDKVLQAMLHW